MVKTFAETYRGTKGPIPDRLHACLAAANDAIARAADDDPALKNMGTTVVAAAISQSGLDWISVGDSPLWLFRDDKLHRLNADHSMAPVLANWVAVGRMTKEEAARSSRRHSLRSAVMGDEIPLIDVSSQSVGIRKDDQLLLASDGLMTLEDEEIARIIENNPDAPLEEICHSTHPGCGRSQTSLPRQYDGVALQARSRFWGGNASRRASRNKTRNRLIKTLVWI